MKTNLMLFLALISTSTHAVEFKMNDRLESQEKSTLSSALREAMDKVPQKFKAGLPALIHVDVKSFGGNKTIPDLCGDTDSKNPVKFTFGQYQKNLKTLTINSVVVNELANGKSHSKSISCQHKSTYDQSIATIIHELTHAYDFNQKNLVSRSDEYLDAANFKKSLFKIKGKNKDPMRSADLYEYKNAAESFAVNMEYFAMDPEFACRKPIMFDFMKKHFGTDPFPNRNCRVNNTYMLTTQMGFVPYKVEMNRVYRIDYLLASKGADIISGFGHSMFRIVTCAPEHVDPRTGHIVPATPYGEKCLEDRLFHLVVSYRANAQDAKLDYIKGFMGGYASMLFMLPFEDVIEEYNREELRDVVSYPLNLTSNEKNELLSRILEEHWNYKGSYKFVTNNCAVEALSLVNNFVETRKEDPKNRLTPYGLRDELISAGLIQANDSKIETFNSQSAHLISAFDRAYGKKFKNKDDAQKALVKYLRGSTAGERIKLFQKIQIQSFKETASKDELIHLKEHLLKSASFSVIEQQAVRVRANMLKKRLGEYSEKMEGKELPADQKQLLSGAQNRLKAEDLTSGGYGIPLEEEIISKDEIEAGLDENLDLLNESQRILKELFPEETGEIENIAKNLQMINQYSNLVRKNYKLALDKYVDESVKVLGQKMDLSKALISDEELNKVRILLGETLVGQTEITNNKLRKIIESKLI